jgi:thiol:disulfide interchange protein DsbD
LSGPFTHAARLEREEAGRGGSSALLVTITIPENTHLGVDRKNNEPRLEPVTPGPAGIVFGSMQAPPPATIDLDLTPTEKDAASKRIEKGVPVYLKEVTLRLPFTVAPEAEPGTRRIEAVLHYSGCQERPEYQCFLPAGVRIGLDFRVTGEGEAAAEGPAPVAGAEAEADESMARGPVAELSAAWAEGRFGALLWGLFLAGLVSVLLPCVYPLVPITLSVIGARAAATRLEAAALAGAYGAGIIAVYVALGLMAGLAGGQFNQFIDHPWVVLAIAALCAALAFGMFGAFSLGLPGAWQTRLSRIGGQGCGGAFLMGAVSGLLASACVGPALIFILVLIAERGSALQGALLLFVYSLGFALPYVAIGATAARLPKPGAWMDVIKNIGGLILLAVSIYYAAKVIPAYLTMLLAGVTAVTVGVFAGAFDPLSAQSGNWPRALKSFGVVSVALGVFGLVGAAYHLGFFVSPQTVAARTPQIAWRHDGERAIRAAADEGKPAILDFVSDTCTLCKEIEAYTLSDAEVVEESRHFVMIKVDTTAGRWPDLVRRYNVRGLPTIVFLDQTGRERRELAVQGGFIGPAEFLRKMKDLLGSTRAPPPRASP